MIPKAQSEVQFKDPHYFVRHSNGRLYCSLCTSPAKVHLGTFRSALLAYAHEKSPEHIAKAETNDVWSITPDEAAWEASDDTLDMWKEYAGSADDVFGRVEAWRVRESEFVKDDMMVGGSWMGVPHLRVAPEYVDDGIEVGEEMAFSDPGDDSDDDFQDDRTYQGEKSKLSPTYVKEFHDWIDRYAQEAGYSPAHRKKLHDFFELPTQGKADTIRKSVLTLQVAMNQFQSKPHRRTPGGRRR